MISGRKNYSTINALTSIIFLIIKNIYFVHLKFKIIKNMNVFNCNKIINNLHEIIKNNKLFNLYIKNEIVIKKNIIM